MESKALVAFVKALKEVQAAEKTKTNPQFKSTYADLSSVIEQANAALHPNGLAFSQEVTTDKEGVSVTTLLIHESGEIIPCAPCWLPVTQKTPQGYGSAITYCRRYSLKARMGMPDEDDDGNAATGTGNTKPPAPEGMEGLRSKVAPQTAPEMTAALRESITAIEQGRKQRLHDDVAFPFGNAKNVRLSEQTEADLAFYERCFKNDIASDDPKKAKFRNATIKQLEGVKAEIAYRKASGT
jgi:hypothetical protein